MSVVDALSTIDTLLTDNWDSSNTDNLTPTFAKVFDKKRVGGRTGIHNDSVLYYEGKTALVPNAFGTSTRLKRTPISIDIRTTSSRARSIKLLEEVDRILQANIISPDSNWDILDPDNGWIDLTNKAHGLFRYVYDIYLIKSNDAR